MKLFLLSKQDLEFAKEEIISLYKPKKYDLIEDILLIETEEDYLDRLALTKKVYQVLGITKDLTELKSIDTKSQNDFGISKVPKSTLIDFLKIIGDNSYKIEAEQETIKKIAGIIYHQLVNPKINLKKPDVIIEIIKREDKYYVCKLIKNISTSWKKRLPHLKPELSPTSLNPRIAMAMINISEKNQGVLCDPFCGTGGLMVEAGLMNYRMIGFDIDDVTLKKAKINLDFYNIKDYKLIERDALKNKEIFDVVVTDLPYGKNTKLSENITKLYETFFEKYYELCETMIIGLPDFIDYKKLIGNWKIKKEFTLYLHKSLSKKILKLAK
jgi:tRNA (guanine10-N2)-dimethyltransferase